MNSANELTTLVDELAAYWTEPTLEILKNAGVETISVDMELDTWRALKKVLHQQLRGLHSFPVTTLVSLSAFMGQTLGAATLLIAAKIEPDMISYEFEMRVHRFARESRATEAEGRIYARIVREPTLHAAYKAPSRSDFTPRLRVAAVMA